MKIQLSCIHIKNYRSIEDAEIKLRPLSVLFGTNDSGKTNLLYALKLAFGGGNITDSDIFVSPGAPFSRDKSVAIDMMFIPTDEKGERTKNFDDSWGLHLGENVSIDENNNEFFAYRMEYAYNNERGDYAWERKLINVWDSNGIVANKGIGFKTLSVFDYVFLDAYRDIAVDIRDKGSLWNKQIAKIEMSNDIKSEIEIALNSIGDRIKSESPFLQEVEDDLSAITNVRKSKVEISPITRNINELYKGLDIYVTPESSNSFSISNLGLGTRGKAVFSVLKSIIKKRFESSRTTPYFCLLALEEPEAHIYPHSQRQLIHAFRQTEGQQIITTHSPYILSTSNINDLIKVSLQGASSKYTAISDISIEREQLLRVERFVLNTRGEILFSNITILAEGETEEQALQVFFNEYFGKTPFELGVNIIGVGGPNYLPFLQILEKIGTKWFIFSDGESTTIKDIKKCIQKLRAASTDIDIRHFGNVIILNDSHNYESYLVSNGYYENIVKAINEFEDNIQDQHRQLFFDHYKDSYTKNHKDASLDEILIACMGTGKLKYASIIARTICNQNSGDKKFPQKIRELMEKVKAALEV
ncbi:MAG: AAA family ATPase [Bacteroidales bacterium]|jgi:putative ATP-dependent endonuclease of OLD family|nr:AAA family ATPase [Bacteroidales bacterium]